ncbi:MAG: glycosyltransferase family 4 protein, partial [Phycisphaerae bacterium]|nr:glycosyltransferase family 4 protein [Phycisphaerae bacterium]
RRMRTWTRFGTYRQHVANCLDALINQNGVDLVEFAEYGTEASVWMHRPRRIPMIVRCHGPASRCGGERIAWRPSNWLKYRRAWLEYHAIIAADAITCPSDAMAELIRIDGRLRGRLIEIIPNAIPYATWASAPAQPQANETDATPEIFTASSVVPPKGVQELVDAVQRLRADGRNIRLTIAGKWGVLGRALDRARHADPELASWLTLPGHLTREELKTRYRQAVLVCFPSWWENCPCACLEAMACGALVVASRAGGIPEIIRDGIDGLLEMPRDAGRLAETLARALDLAPDAQTRLRTNAQERIRTTFDVDVVIPRMLRVYAAMIQQHARPSRRQRGSA